jgi:hypothetical protein
METRKRPLDDDIVPTSAKKRALTSPTGTPQASNGLIDVEESQDQINVEVRIEQEKKTTFVDQYDLPCLFSLFTTGVSQGSYLSQDEALFS